MRARVVPVANLFVGWVREASGANDGPWVEAIQRLTGNRRGDAWCASFVCMVLDISYRGKNPLPRSASCDVLLTAARTRGWLFEEPEPGDIFLVMRTKSDAVHTGVVVATSGLAIKSVEGNASDPSKPATREGWGCYARERNKKGLLFIRIPDQIPTEVVGGRAAVAP